MDTENSGSSQDRPESGGGGAESSQDKPETQPTPQSTTVDKQESPFAAEKAKWAEDIRKILEDHRLYYDQDQLEKELSGNNERYLRLSVVELDPSGENNRMIIQERFFKAPLPQEKPEDQLEFNKKFVRQVRVQEYLAERTQIPVTEVLDSNTDETQGPLYAIMNWYQSGEDLGFVHSEKDIQRFTQEHARLAVKILRGFQHQEGSITNEVIQSLAKSKDDFKYYPLYENFSGFRQQLASILARQVTGVDDLYQAEKRTFGQVIAERLGVGDLNVKIDYLLTKVAPTIEAAQGNGSHLVHGDFHPSNVFLGDGVTAQPFVVHDFELAGLSPNEVLATVFDFGDMRARSWNNPAFVEALDQEMISSYRAEGREGVGRTIIALGILRSHLNIAGWFENYPPEKATENVERRRDTEGDIRKAWEILGLDLEAKREIA